MIGIEGLDYLEKIEDIDILYKLGVRTVNPVWNNHNKFGTGVRPCKIIHKQKGLTPLGKELIHKLIETKIVIDVSHADEETFWDIIKECKQYKDLNPKVIASHSNSKEVYNVPRNLSDKQINAIKEFEGIIGIVSVKQFCSDSNYKQNYVQHIKHIKNLLGGVQNIVLSTDDMTYYDIEPEYYQNFNIFKQERVNSEISKLLRKNNFSKEEIEQILNTNFIRFCQTI